MLTKRKAGGKGVFVAEKVVACMTMDVSKLTHQSLESKKSLSAECIQNRWDV